MLIAETGDMVCSPLKAQDSHIEPLRAWKGTLP